MSTGAPHGPAPAAERTTAERERASPQAEQACDGPALAAGGAVAPILALQRGAGNAAVARLLRQTPGDAGATAPTGGGDAGRRPRGSTAGLPPHIAEKLEEQQRAADQRAAEGGGAEHPQEIDRAAMATERAALESETRAAAPKPEKKLGEVEAAAHAAKQAADSASEVAAGKGDGGTGAAAMGAGGGAGGGDAGAEARGRAAAATSAAMAVAEPPAPAAVTPPAAVVPVDAGGRPLAGLPGSEEAVAALALKAQILRDQGHALRVDAAAETAGAHALGAQIAESLAGVDEAHETIGRSREGINVRRGVQEQARQALAVSEEKQRMVAEKAPELAATAAEQQANSAPMAGEAADLAGQSSSADVDDDEAAAKTREQGGEISRVSDQVASVDQTFTQSKQRADALAQDAAQAQASNTATSGRIAETDAAIGQTDARLGELDTQNQEARAQLQAHAEGPGQLLEGAAGVDGESQALIAASAAIEERLVSAQEAHRAALAAVPALEEPSATAAAGAPVGPGGTLAREEQRYGERTNLDLGGRAAALAGPTLLWGTGLEPPSVAARRQAEADERSRRQAELDQINAMCDGHFERLDAGDKAMHALRLTARHLWGGVAATKWPQFGGHLLQALIDPRISLMGIVSGLSMALSGVANIANAAAWKADPLGNALKIAADIATGITIILGSVVGLATAILALAWALAIFTFGLAGGVAAVVTPICTAVISTVFPWTVFAAKWALALQALVFLKNLYDAATAKSASDLQNQADQMSEDAKSGLAMAAIIVVAKGAEVGGRALANTRLGAAVGRGVQSVGEWAKIYPTGGAGAAAAAGTEAAASGAAGEAASGGAAAGEAGASAEAGGGAGQSGATAGEPAPVSGGGTGAAAGESGPVSGGGGRAGAASGGEAVPVVEGEAVEGEPGSAPRGAEPGGPQVSDPDVPAVSDPDVPAVSDPDVPAVSDPDAPAVSGPDAPQVSDPVGPRVPERDAPRVSDLIAPPVRRPIHSRYPDGTLVYEGEQPGKITGPKADDPHTVLQWDEFNGRVYKAREYGEGGVPIRDIDFTHPTFPSGRLRPDHAAPEQHRWIPNDPNNPSAGFKRGPGEPLK